MNQEAPRPLPDIRQQTAGEDNLNMPQVLKYLQREWRTHERERCQWDLEKVDLTVRE